MIVRSLLVIFSLLALSGCFESEENVLPVAENDTSLFKPGSYVTCELMTGKAANNDVCEFGSDISLKRFSGLHICHKVPEYALALARKGDALDNSSQCHSTEITLGGSGVYSVKRSGPEGSQRSFNFSINKNKIKGGTFDGGRVLSRCSKGSGECKYFVLEPIIITGSSVQGASLLPPQCATDETCEVSGYEELLAGIKQSTSIKTHGAYMVYSAEGYDAVVRYEKARQ